MRRGDIFFAAQRGSQTQKKRPVVVVQNDASLRSHSLVAVCLLTSKLQPTELYRVSIAPGGENGLDRASQVMVDRIFAFGREGLRTRLGNMTSADMGRVDDALRRWLSL